MIEPPDEGDVPPPAIPQKPGAMSPGPVGMWTIRVLGLAGLTLSTYLLVISLGEQRLPVGCGAGSGCASVLSSRWSNVLGIPVGGLAVATYCVVLAGSFFI